MEKQTEHFMRMLPSVDSLLKDAELQDRTAGVPRNVVVDSVRSAVESVRKQLLEDKAAWQDEAAVRRAIIDEAAGRAEAVMQPHYRKVVNATGIILHTGLGRAVLAGGALRQIQNELSGYSLLQLDTETGKRSRRDERIECLLRRLTGAEAAAVVNNNAAATSIVLNTAAKGKEVIVSRGQLVEIGGSFRLPDVMAFSGAGLVEVGTTNRTHPRDYENAITENTAAILRVHPSNYKIQGFTSEVPLDELVEIAHAHQLLMIDDVGSGALIDLSPFGFDPEPTLPESISKGADIVTSSADKLMGASQAGIILGKAHLIEAVRKNPFARIVRPGKLTLAALEATLKLFLDESVALSEVPALQMLMRNLSDIAAQAEQIVRELSNIVSDAVLSTEAGFSQTGSGSLPAQNLATRLVAVRSENIGAEALAAQLRHSRPPIFARIQNDQVLIDPRTLRTGEDRIVIDALIHILGGKK